MKTNGSMLLPGAASTGWFVCSHWLTIVQCTSKQMRMKTSSKSLGLIHVVSRVDKRVASGNSPHHLRVLWSSILGYDHTVEHKIILLKLVVSWWVIVKTVVPFVVLVKMLLLSRLFCGESTRTSATLRIIVEGFFVRSREIVRAIDALKKRRLSLSPATDRETVQLRVSRRHEGSLHESK